MFYVNLYLDDRAYGGPEEGGWWFDCGEPVRSFGFHTRSRAARWLPRIQRLADAKNKAERRREPSSVICEGWYAARIEDAPAANYPAQRPHYE